MKTKLKCLFAATIFLLIINNTSYAQPAADLILTGNPNKAVYEGFPVSGTFDVTLANNTFVDIPPSSFEITFTMPPGFIFNNTYPGIPAGWSYVKRGTGQTAALTPTATVSGQVPSFITFSVPFTTSASVNNQPYTVQIQRLFPSYIDADQNNNTPSGNVTVSNIDVLPVDFLSIAATIKNCQAQVDWKVANQLNLKQYEVEISTDGTNFTLGKTLPANNQLAYSASLSVSGNATYFYRVKSVDLDGKFKYSGTASAKADCDGNQGAFSVYPNPVLKGKTINLLSHTNEPTKFRVLDMSGKTIKQGTFNSQTTLQLSASGTYIIDLHTPSTTEKVKVVVQ